MFDVDGANTLVSQTPDKEQGAAPAPCSVRLIVLYANNPLILSCYQTWKICVRR